MTKEERFYERQDFIACFNALIAEARDKGFSIITSTAEGDKSLEYADVGSTLDEISIS